MGRKKGLMRGSRDLDARCQVGSWEWGACQARQECQVTQSWPGCREGCDRDPQDLRC